MITVENKQSKLFMDHVMGMPPLWFGICAIIVLSSAWMGLLPKDMIGGFAVCMVLGHIMYFLGVNIPFIRKSVGGMFMVALGLGILKFLGVWPQNLLDTASGFIGGSTNFITFYICGLICGSILGMNRKLLISAGLRYFVPLVGGIFFAYAFGAIAGEIVGIGWKDTLLYIAGPIMGGGTGGGAIPLSEIYSEAMVLDKDIVFSRIYPSVTVGGITSLFLAAIINAVGKKFTALSGEGVLMKGYDLKDTEAAYDYKFSLQDLGIGLLVACSLFILGKVAGSFVPSVHYYAFVIGITAIAKISGVIPQKLEYAAIQWYKFLSSVFTITMMAGVGLTMVNIGELISILTPGFFAVCLFVVIGAVIGAGLVGMLVKFFFIESAITAGLCMSNVGGAGDVAILSASERMNLMPFAQISSRLGGAMVLILQGILVRILL
ncbi:2-hydroxycarboxylate transporter family protein [Oscillospiraceae bacterium LTW-04]|nr:2-hydroxycarboxylate transporter family protein [Oscillospiraceae bacterium MB24-C1]